MSALVRIGTLALNALCFVLALAFCGSLLRRSQPEPYIPVVTEKLAQFAATGPYDVVFLGSSKIFRGIVPSLFDAEAARRGHPLRSFNLGVDGMGFSEATFLFDQLTRRGGGSIRWVVVELAGVRTAFQPAERGTKRELYWRDWPRTRWICRCILSGENGSPALPLLDEHLQLFFRRSLGMGLGAERAPAILGLPVSKAAPLKPPTADAGYEAMPFGLTEAARKQFLEELGRMDTEKPKPGLPGSGAALRAFAREVESRGAKAIFILPPNTLPTRRHLEAGATGPVPPLWAFDDPHLYPALYQVEHRADALHLTDAAARDFTLLLAERFSVELGSAPEPASRKGVAP